MAFLGKEKRTCARFKVPGATLSFKRTGFFTATPDYEDEYCPVLDMSLGGLRFLTQKKLKTNAKVSMKITLLEQKDPFVMLGKVKWSIFNPGFSYKYQVGVQFSPYGDKEGYNTPEDFAKIKKLEWTYAENTKEKE